jgi:hypothetical protein
MNSKKGAARSLSVAIVRREYPCTECAGDATLGFSNWRGPTGQIIGNKERLCSACAKKRRITFSFHAQPNDKITQPGT